tara:strand:- start:483 stop:587 length:105 start_codon:yes stop_codon:yes gene_type:complete
MQSVRNYSKQAFGQAIYVKALREEAINSLDELGS